MKEKLECDFAIEIGEILEGNAFCGPSPYISTAKDNTILVEDTDTGDKFFIRVRRLPDFMELVVNTIKSWNVNKRGKPIRSALGGIRLELTPTCIDFGCSFEDIIREAEDKGIIRIDGAFVELI